MRLLPALLSLDAAADVEGILSKINGQPCSIDCTPDGHCTFDIQNFFVTLVAPCQTASCVVPGLIFAEGERARALRMRVYWVGLWGAAEGAAEGGWPSGQAPCAQAGRCAVA